MLAYHRGDAFTCGFCFESFPEGSRHVKAGTDTVCKRCFQSDLKPRFLEALKYEHHYPVRWGSTVLNPRDFPFTIKFLAQWHRRKRFYALPKSERIPIMCSHLCAELPSGDLQAIDKAEYESRKRKGEPTAQCQRYLGIAKETEHLQRKCRKCCGISCGVCGVALQQAPPGHDRKVLDHDCDRANLTKPSLPEVPLVRGADFQLCPKPDCQEAYSLESGCNVMFCTRCRTHFCFLCGVAAHHDSDHWTTTCPRWNRPGAANAHFDHAEPPREIDEGIRDSIDELKDMIADEDDPRLNAILIDQTIALVLSGDAIARLDESRRAEADGEWGADVDFVGPLLNILMQLRFLSAKYVYSTELLLDGSLEMRAGQIYLFKKAVKSVRFLYARFEQEEPAVFQLYPSLRPMVVRVTERAESVLQEVALALEEDAADLDAAEREQFSVVQTLGDVEMPDLLVESDA